MEDTLRLQIEDETEKIITCLANHHIPIMKKRFKIEDKDFDMYIRVYSQQVADFVSGMTANKCITHK